MFSRGIGTKRHSAYRSAFAIVEYRWHPLRGKRLAVFRRTGPLGSEHVHVDAGDGFSRELPAWMFDAALCSAMELGAPQVALEALNELREVLSLASSGQKQPASLAAAEEDGGLDEANRRCGNKTARTGAGTPTAPPVDGGDTRGIDTGAGRSTPGSARRRAIKYTSAAGRGK